MNEFLRSGFPFNYDQDQVSDETGLFCQDVSLAQQHARDESDINTIVRRFGLSGQMPVGVRMPSYEDFTSVTDFQSAMNAVALARESFDRMPAVVRARFGNDPGRFVDFVSDESNREEAVRLGLVEPQAPVVPAVVPSQPAPAAGAPGAGVEPPVVA